jgi:RNA polymerase primary sigma factor
VSASIELDYPAAPDLGADPEDDTTHSDLGYFMESASRFPLLGASEERELGRRIWAARARLLRIIRRQRRRKNRSVIELDPRPGRRPATASTRRRLMRVEALAREIETPTRRLEETLRELDDARGTLVEHNLRLVVWVAKRFRGRGFDFIDLIQEGCLGLMRAVDRFDPRVGTRFSTFATHWIAQGIRRALAERSRTIRVPVNRIPEVQKTLSARSTLSMTLGRAPNAYEIASAVDLPQAKVEELLPALGAIDSIDACIRGTDRILGDTLEDRSGRVALDLAMEEETRRTIRTVLDELPRRQRIILSMRHGIDYPRECTLDEIGDALGLSRERIRQVEKVATRAVRDWIEKHRPALAEPV